MKSIVKATTNPEISAREIKNSELARLSAAEGIVLLKNEKSLPIKPCKIALYGSGARKTLKGGTGSGDVKPRNNISIEDGLKSAGYEITTDKWLNRFDDYYIKLRGEWENKRDKALEGLANPWEAFGIIGKMPFQFPTGVAISTDDISNSDCETAIYVIARQSGEGTDRQDVKGDWQLDDLEYNNLKAMADNYSNIIVVINSGGMIDLSFMDEMKNIKALIWYVQGGQEGGNALADVISGEVIPSGKLTATWANKYIDYPNYDYFSYNDGDTYNEEYKEGIYVGYRYFDTFNIDVRYPFGYGLSYTDFEIYKSNVRVNGDKILVNTKIKNIGDYEGKEVVQCYMSAPSLPDGAEYQQLVAFCKTELITPGKSVIVDLEFKIQDFARYDEKTASWLLPEGRYIVRVGNSSRSTVDSAIIVLDNDVITEKCENICIQKNSVNELSPNNSGNIFYKDLPIINIHSKDIEKTINNYHLDEPEASEKVKELINSLPVESLAKLVVGGGIFGERLVNVLGVAGSTTMDLYKSNGIPNIVLSDGPAGLNVAKKCVLTSDGLVKPTEIPEHYDFEPLRTSISSMLATEKDGEMHYQYATAWPVGTMIAQTWNLPLAQQIGEAVAVEMQEFGITYWLAPGMNIQRNPFCGRNFEYFSEDPLLTGLIAAAITKGVQSAKGCGVTLKHYCCNNQEDNRAESSSNISERALREIYLKGFRITIEKSSPNAVMTSYNLVNGIYTANSDDLLNKVLRCEWGFKGFVMSDWNACDYGRAKPELCITAGNDLIMPGTSDQIRQIVDALEEGRISIEKLKRCSTRVLKAIDENNVIEIN